LIEVKLGVTVTVKAGVLPVTLIGTGAMTVLAVAEICDTAVSDTERKSL
jgi:hypothetical protein